MTLDLGVFLPTMSPRDTDLVDVVAAARHAESLGFESAWVVDQLVAGTGVPFIESTVAIAAAATATDAIALAFGVMIVPLRPVAWIAKQVASLQHLSNDRIILGVGVGGDRHDRSWAATGVPRHERGRRTDEALRALPGLIAGRPTQLDDRPDAPAVQLSPAATVPPIVVGGMSDAAVRRAASFDGGWFIVPTTPHGAVAARERMAEIAASIDRPPAALTASVMTAIEGDPQLPSRDSIHRSLVDPDGMFGIPAEHVGEMLVQGPPTAVAERLAGLADAGASRVVVTLTAGDWFHQAELLARARQLID